MRVLVASTHSEAPAWVQGIASAGYAVDLVTGRAGLDEHLRVEAQDVVVIGQDLLDEPVQQAVREVGMIVVTDDGADDQRWRLLRDGAKDALTPPFGVRELQLRVSLFLTHRTADPGQRVVELGRVRFDRVGRVITVDGRDEQLAPQTLCVFDHLVAYRHRLISEAELLAHCWNADRDLFSDPLTTQLYRLRQVFDGFLRIRHVNQYGFHLEVVDGSDGPGGVSADSDWSG